MGKIKKWLARKIASIAACFLTVSIFFPPTLFTFFIVLCCDASVTVTLKVVNAAIKRSEEFEALRNV